MLFIDLCQEERLLYLLKHTLLNWGCFSLSLTICSSKWRTKNITVLIPICFFSVKHCFSIALESIVFLPWKRRYSRIQTLRKTWNEFIQQSTLVWRVIVAASILVQRIHSNFELLAAPTVLCCRSQSNFLHLQGFWRLPAPTFQSQRPFESHKRFQKQWWELCGERASVFGGTHSGKEPVIWKWLL